MEIIAQDNLKEIFYFLNNPLYFLILKQVNKEWKQIIENEIKIENTNTRKYFHSLVNDFISRKDFEKLNIQFTFLNQDLFSNFSRFGFLNSVKYLHEKNPKTKKIKTKVYQEIKWDKWTCISAAENGHLFILKYLHENGCIWDEWSFYHAVSNGHFECLKYLDENDCPRNSWICKSAAENGHLDILKYLHEKEFPYLKYTCLDVAKNKETKEYIEKFM